MRSRADTRLRNAITLYLSLHPEPKTADELYAVLPLHPQPDFYDFVFVLGELHTAGTVIDHPAPKPTIPVSWSLAKPPTSITRTLLNRS